MKRLLLIARYSKIEPLGLMYLATIAREEGWGVDIELAGQHNGEWIWGVISGRCAQKYYDIIGMTVYTGTHMEAFDLCDRLRDGPNVTIIGGPHATCFPDECAKHADYVVQGEGLHSLRSILRGKAEPGIMPFKTPEKLPLPDRRIFYDNYPKHFASPIKSVVAWTGCPYACTYCYNSMGKGKFPLKKRPVEDVIRECENLMEVAPDTKLIYFQDDVFGPSTKWLEQFCWEYQSRVKIPFHCQTRVELLDPNKYLCQDRATSLLDGGCTGVTIAIESADEEFRRDVLGRKMSNKDIRGAIWLLSDVGLKVRTEQMLGLPTQRGIEADLETLKFNVELRQEFGEPTMAWASVFVPYYGTKIWDYCRNNGYYDSNNDDAPATFFERSVLNFDDEYKDKMLRLRDAFHLFALVPNGHELAGEWLYNEKSNLLDNLKTHLYDSVLYNVKGKDNGKEKDID